MYVSVITAFPELFNNFLSTSIVGRAVKKNLIRVEIINLRDFGRGNYKQIDDYAFGSGGMVLSAPVLQDALDEAVSRAKNNNKSNKSFVVYPSPQGVLLTQEIVETLANQEHVIILCGHYEGVDERFIEANIDLELTVGDCVLTGGEVPAMTVIDAMSRLVPGVVGRGEAVKDDSFYNGMLDHPHYTRPESWQGRDVPKVLLSGNNAEINHWRHEQAINRTLERRPDLISRASIRDYISDGIYFAAGFVDINNRQDGAAVSALSSLSRYYKLGRPFIIVPDRIMRKDVSELCSLVPREPPRVLGSLERALEWINSRVKTRDKSGERQCLVINILPKPESGAVNILEAKRKCLEHEGPVLFFIADGEYSEKIFNNNLIKAAFTSENENENTEKDAGDLPLALRASAALDRFLGKR